ncbi:BCAM0308 family protein [Pseudomonas indica]|uniref:ATPase n=1 Tax=Pseudomonas indica TaxID=137658 RepID=A0A1G9BVV6_9PSED|nr:BCAM0308 family protein [Pseudomonas indica]SDK43105.1 hypothetical protein SAMN05216186_10729 [Pseudomonas indica]
MDKYQQSHKDKLFKSKTHDPYLAEHSAGPALCPHCGALYRTGHWAWSATIPAETEMVICPACRRVAENRPAGTLNLSGAFLGAHRQDIINLIRNTEQLEKAEHALERIIGINEDKDTVEVTTTGLHLANRIGHALGAAYKGHSRYQYSDDETHLSIHWERD